MCLRYLEEAEGLRLVNIDSTDIADCRIKLILGLVWTLILHYSITMSLQDTDENNRHSNKNAPNPKQRLLDWINSKIPHRPVKNFTSDWNDGTAIGALVDAIAPGLCPDADEWNPKEATKNAKEAMDQAEKYLDIPQLIRPNEMTNPRVDEKAMMTYLSQFPAARLAHNAPLHSKTNLGAVKAFGPGLELHGNEVNKETSFIVDATEAGRGQISVVVLNPKGQKVQCNAFNDGNSSQRQKFTYVPKQQGEHRIIIKFSNKEIPRSPFKVNVTGPVGDKSKISANGPGLEPTGNAVDRRTFFNVFTEGAGEGKVDCVILDPKSSQNSVLPKVTQQSPTNFLVEYTPKIEGLHSVNIFFNGEQIPNSPYGVMVDATSDSTKAYATGRGIQPQGVRVKDLADFKVHTENAGDGDLEVRVVGPGNVPERCRTKQTGSHLHECSYVPQKPGEYCVEVKYDGEHIQESPFKVSVKPFLNSNIRAYGPGLIGGVVNKPAVFIVETNGETGALGFSIKGPGETKIDCVDNEDGSARITYWPTVAGEYAVHILCSDEDIPNSPYMPIIVDGASLPNVDNIKAYGPGLQPSGVEVNQPAEFTIDGRQAGVNAAAHPPIKAECYNKRGEPVPVQCKPKQDGTFACTYKPKELGKHSVIIDYANLSIPNSPFKVNVSEAVRPEKVKVYGPGIDSACQNKPTTFTVDCKYAGPGNVSVSILDENRCDVPNIIRPNGDDTYNVQYTPTTCGPFYTIQVTYAGFDVARSPYKVPITPDINPSNYEVDGLQQVVPVGVPQEFEILTPGLSHAMRQAKPKIDIVAPGGFKVPVKIEDTVDGYAVSYVPNKVGLHKAMIEIGGKPIGRSPYSINVTTSSPVKQHGQGPPILPRADFLDANEAPLIRPKNAKLSHSPNRPFVGGSPANQAGMSDFPADSLDEMVRRANRPEEEKKSAMPNAGVKAYGDGLYRGTTNKPALFTIDSKLAPAAPIGVTIEGPAEAKINYNDRGDGTCGVSYIPKEPGNYDINILYDDQPIKGSPFNAVIEPESKVPDVGKVHAYGPGLAANGVLKDSFAKFTVDAKSIDPHSSGEVKAIVKTPQKLRTACLVSPTGNGLYSCSYSTNSTGPHEIEVLYENQPINSSPFHVNVSEGNDPRRVRAYGPGLVGGKSGEKAKFTVDLGGAGQGGLSLAVEGPTDVNVQCKDNRDGTCSAEYLPTQAGEYDVSVKFNDAHIPGSPFNVPIRDVVDPSKVKCYGPGLEDGGLRQHQPANFVIDASKAGDAPLEVNLVNPKSGTRKPIAVIPRDHGPPGIYDATMIADSQGPYKAEVKFANQNVPGCPFNLKSLPECEPEKVVVTGEGVRPSRGKIPAEVPVQFFVDTTGAGDGDLELAVVDPSGESVDLDVQNHEDGRFTCEYVPPNEIGNCQVFVKFGGADVPGSVFSVPINAIVKPDQCQIAENVAKKVPLNEEVSIPVNTKKAGPGRVQARILDPIRKSVPVKISHTSKETQTVSYTPSVVGPHNIDIEFDNRPIPRGKFVQTVFDVGSDEVIVPHKVIKEETTKVFTEQVQTVCSDSLRPVNFTFSIGPAFNAVEAYVLTPSGRRDRPHVRNNNDQSITIQYSPTEVGQHELHVTYDGQEIPSCPIKFFVEALKGTGNVTAYGPGLSSGTVGERCNFTIVTNNAGAGGLSLSVEGPSKAEIQCRDNKDGTVNVDYYPVVAGEYIIDIKFQDAHIQGSPFVAKIRDDPIKRNQISVGTTSDVPLAIADADFTNLRAIVYGPSGKEEPSILKKLPSGNLGVSFTPRECGEHNVEVLRNNAPIANSPFRVYVSPNEIADASLVKVYGDGIKHANVNAPNEFTVDTRGAGFGNLHISIEGPSRATLNCYDKSDGVCSVVYTPIASGQYTIRVKYADNEVRDSPFVVNAGDDFDKKISTRTEHFIRRSHDSTNPLSEPPRALTEKIFVSGSGLYRGTTNVENEFNVYTNGSGSGDVSVAIDGPGRADINFENRERGVCIVKYRVCEPGTYTCNVKFNEIPVAGSPFKIVVEDSTITRSHIRSVSSVSRRERSVSPCEAFDNKRQTVAIVHDRKLRVGQQAGFTVNSNLLSKGKLRPSAYVISPRGERIDATVESVHSSAPDQQQFSVRFIPRENGPHKVFVSIDGNPIAGSPFHVNVGEETQISSTLSIKEVRAYGNGLIKGYVGDRNSFNVDTVGAGNGSLSVTVDGPNKVHLNCTETKNGYEFTYSASHPGTYIISIKFADVEIQESPFKVNIYSNQRESFSPVRETRQQTSYVTKEVKHRISRAEKVQCSGPGLKCARIGHTNYFSVDAGYAGSDVLYVGVSGPTRPCEEVNIKHTGQNKFMVTYCVEEQGLHHLMIKWGDCHVPGSPFIISVP